MTWRDSGSTDWRDRIDFPVSHSFFRSLCVQHGEQDPGPCYTPIKETLPDIWKVDVSERYFENCLTCFHQTPKGFCACRERSDMMRKCADWTLR